MSIFSKAKKLVKKVSYDVGLKDKPRRPAPANPDPINPLTGRPMSQNMPQQPAGIGMQGLGQMPPAYLPQPVSMAQRVPQGLGSPAFRSTLAPLQQPNYGLGQVDPRFLQGIQQIPGGNAGMIPFQPPQRPPVSVNTDQMYS